MIILTVTKQDQDCAIRILDNCGGNWQSISKEIAKYRTEREAQAVQREREDAKAVVEAGQAVIARWDTPLWKDVEHTGVSINKLRRALAIYSDNRKG